MSCAFAYVQTSFVVQAASGLTLRSTFPDGSRNGSTSARFARDGDCSRRSAVNQTSYASSAAEERSDLVTRAAGVRARLPQSGRRLGRAQIHEIQLASARPARRDRCRSARSGAPCRGRARGCAAGFRAACARATTHSAWKLDVMQGVCGRRQVVGDDADASRSCQDLLQRAPDRFDGVGVGRRRARQARQTLGRAGLGAVRGVRPRRSRSSPRRP